MSSNINILFFGQLREQLGCNNLSWPLEQQISTAALLDKLIEQHPQWRAALSSSAILMAVNQTMANADTLLAAGDEVAFFPPVTGG